MKKIEIIKDSREFSYIINNGKNTKNKFFSIYYMKNTDKNRYGITIPTKTGKAVIRNKLKRQVKSIVDNNKLCIQTPFNYVIIVRKSALDINYITMERELINLLKKTGEK